MASYVRMNALDQALDIAGSLLRGDSRTLADENAGLGLANANSGTTSVTLAGPDGDNLMTLSGLTGGSFSTASEGQFLSVAGAGLTAGNVGTFLIVTYVSATSVKILNASGVAEGPIASVAWQERAPYTLEDDLNFARTDRKAIKGTANYYAGIPTYTRPTDTTDTSVPANLTNIAGKTTDAKALVVNKVFRGVIVASTNTHKELVSVGNMPHATSTNRTGIPINDGADAGADQATYVEITKSDDGSELVVQSGGDAGKRIFGRTRAGTGVAATGTINVVAGANLLDTDYFTLNDGINTPVVFEFDSDSSVTPGRIAVPYTSGDSATVVQGSVVTAINGVTTALLITAAAGTSPAVTLTNDNVGVQGNATQSENVADAGFTITNMTGGAGGFSPDSVDVEFRCVAIGADLSTSSAYTWEASQPTTVDMAYGYRKRLDLFGDTDLRVTMTQGLATDADLRQDVEDLRDVLDTALADGATSLAGLLTPDTNYYVWSDLPDATPSVVEALNTLNTQIGDRVWTGGVLSSGDTLTSALQDLSDAITAAPLTRLIVRAGSNYLPGATLTLPGGNTYVLDGSGNGNGLWVWWRGVLRDPGLVSGGNDYSEATTATITIHSKINIGDHINYIINK